jgi:hypothetical protein
LAKIAEMFREKQNLSPESNTSVFMHGFKRENLFVKDNVSRNINTSGGRF